ncbi:hypothetical protein DPMN_157256 [Dreissena polymorpha]|uniref:Uncharacterized protein n=1 Tax=Dreissena polymorpha TaxID=45954 RepID=A0A9D4EGW1_DREPO|nr:hypothetical protein DPMN_157256 [Dreissena polymorpha]
MMWSQENICDFRSGSGRAGRSKSLKLKSSQRLDSSPDSRNNSALNHTLQLNASPERGSHPPIVSGLSLFEAFVLFLEMFAIDSFK